MLVCVLKVCFNDLDFICVSVSSICKIELAAGDSSRRQSQGQVVVNITANTGNKVHPHAQDSWCPFCVDSVTRAARDPFLTAA